MLQHKRIKLYLGYNSIWSPAHW